MLKTKLKKGVKGIRIQLLKFSYKFTIIGKVLYMKALEEFLIIKGGPMVL